MAVEAWIEYAKLGNSSRLSPLYISVIDKHNYLLAALLPTEGKVVVATPRIRIDRQTILQELISGFQEDRCRWKDIIPTVFWTTWGEHGWEEWKERQEAEKGKYE